MLSKTFNYQKDCSHPESERSLQFEVSVSSRWILAEHCSIYLEKVLKIYIYFNWWIKRERIQKLFLQMQYDGNLNQSLNIPLHSLLGSKANSLCKRYCCSQRHPRRQSISSFSYLEKQRIWYKSEFISFKKWSSLTCMSPCECTARMGRGSVMLAPDRECYWPSMEQILLLWLDKRFWTKRFFQPLYTS